MCNQIAIRVHTQPQDEVICDKRSHVYLYEGGGMAFNSLVSARLPGGAPEVSLDREMVAAAINPDNIHFPVSRLVVLENTCNKGGGSFYSLDQVAGISQLCQERGLKLHVDGARIFHALLETGVTAQEFGKYVDTVSICLSKGLGAPVGSVLVGSKDDIRKALRVRKVLGGGMRPGRNPGSSWYFMPWTIILKGWQTITEGLSNWNRHCSPILISPKFFR